MKTKQDLKVRLAALLLSSVIWAGCSTDHSNSVTEPPLPNPPQPGVVDGQTGNEPPPSSDSKEPRPELPDTQIDPTIQNQ